MKETGKVAKEVEVVFLPDEKMWHILLLPVGDNLGLEFESQEEADQVGKAVAKARKCSYTLYDLEGNIREKG